mmetsp:Transcript_55521/g.162240  ORF Transcript_55521/g.162240 Transcript_55521/m.162240 type:complete len:200 (-) Transcript_55521:4123-4722(-)
MFRSSVQALALRKCEDAVNGLDAVSCFQLLGPGLHLSKRAATTKAALPDAGHSLRQEGVVEMPVEVIFQEVRQGGHVQKVSDIPVRLWECVVRAMPASAAQGLHKDFPPLGHVHQVNSPHGPEGDALGAGIGIRDHDAVPRAMDVLIESVMLEHLHDPTRKPQLQQDQRRQVGCALRDQHQGFQRLVSYHVDDNLGLGC